MRTTIALFVLLAACGASQARDNNVAPKKDLDPWDKSRVTRAEARNWVERAPNHGALLPSEKKNCQTNVAAQSAPQQRFGPGNGSASRSDQVVVVKGDVINVCK